MPVVLVAVEGVVVDAVREERVEEVRVELRQVSGILSQASRKLV